MEVSVVKAELIPKVTEETTDSNSQQGKDNGDKENKNGTNSGNKNQNQNPDVYEVDYSLQLTTFLGEVNETHTLKLVREELEDGAKVWRINWKPSMILTDMVKGSKVRVRTLFPERGDIFDREGLPLATKGNIYEWGIIPEKLGENPETMIARIAEHYKVTADIINTALAQKWVKPEYFVPIASTEDSRVPAALAGVQVQSKEIR
ncbi:hypothetical protein PC115_g25657, partial [Phytophthora cactorum]